MRDPIKRQVVAAILEMARALEIEVMAEGVETEAQRDWLAKAGVESGQGFLFARAVPSDEFEKRYLSAENTPAKV